MAPWYAGWAGSGSNFHRQYAIPELLKALELKRGMRVIELGCGMGALRESVEKAGVDYVGVDKSPSMIREAKKRGGHARFYVSDVAKPGGVAIPEKEKFDRAVFMFSIQDIDNHRDAIKNAALLLKPGGELALFMVHPAFRIPRQSGWGKDEGRKLTFRRVDRYKTEITIPLPQRTGDHQVTSFFYHRPLSSYALALKDAGFVIKDMKEIYSSTKGHESEFPHFMLLRAKL
jgi:ubiquinone/menaquinone biosynthesis C-methylase UbiE